jgi:hypothetical protein
MISYNIYENNTIAILVFVIIALYCDTLSVTNIESPYLLNIQRKKLGNTLGIAARDSHNEGARLGHGV